MAEVSYQSQSTQLGVEVTPGTGVAANKLLQAISITPGIKANIQKLRPKGSKFTTITALGKEWTEAGIEANVVCYNHLAYLLSGILAYAAPAQQGSGAAYKQVFTPAQSAEDSIKTYTVEQGNATRAQKFNYGLVNELALKFSRDEIGLTGNMLGQAIQDAITMTATPTAVPIQPVLPSTLDVYLDPTSATLGTTKLTRAFTGELQIGKRFAPVWPINSAINGFAAHVEDEPEYTLKLLVAADAQGMGNLTAMRAGTKQFIRLKAVGPLIAATYYYTLQIDLCGSVVDVGEFKDQDKIKAIEWTFEPTFDATWTKALTVELTNTNVTL